MLGIGKLSLQSETLLNRHGGAERGLDAVARAQTGDLGLDMVRQLFVSERHVGPHGVTADGRAFHTAQHAAEWRLLAPRRVGVPDILVAIIGGIGRLVDSDEAGMIRVATRYGVIFKLAEIARERDVLGATDVLIAEEQNLVLQQQRSDLFHKTTVTRCNSEIDVADLCTNRARQRFDPRGRIQDYSGYKCWCCVG